MNIYVIYWQEPWADGWDMLSWTDEQAKAEAEVARLTQENEQGHQHTGHYGWAEVEKL